MINSVNSGYVYPQAVMRQGSQMDRLNINTAEKAEKKQRTLEEEKQAVQNSLLLLKTTSSDSVGSEESIKLLEKKLDELENQIKAEKQEPVIKSNFDIYSREAWNSMIDNTNK